LSKVFIVAALFFVGISSAQAEVITDFSSTYTINNDGTVLVVENIEYDFEDESRRGIFRTLQNNHPQPATKSFSDRFVEIAVIEVLQDGVPGEFEIIKEGKNTEIKIGNPNIYLEGEHAYQITYLLRGALSYGADGAELYWNATGNGWPVQLERVAVTVTGSGPGIIAVNSACYLGAVGSTAACDQISTTSTETTFSAQNVPAFSGLTIAQQIDEASVTRLIVEKPNIMWMLWVLGGLWLAGLIVWAVRFHSANKINKPIIAQYEPYKNFLPMYTGLLIDFKLDPHDITAAIIYLAEQGFFAIKKTEKKMLFIFTASDYEITLKRPPEDIPTQFLLAVSSLLFYYDSPVHTTVLLSSLIKKQSINSKVVLKLKSLLQKDLELQGFTEAKYRTAAKIIFPLFFIVFGIIYTIFAAIGALDASAMPLAAILTFETLVIYARANYNRRSKEGYEALNHILGFKLFLSVTEKERYTFFNTPEKSPQQFMKFLPYAIALKVEKEWAKVFDGITIPNPNWYSDGNIGAFSAAAFTSDMSAFATNFSSTSGTSASSGGGSSGGGGGGGGGGSW
jgi:uncharacterized membrane protein YgcG